MDDTTAPLPPVQADHRHVYEFRVRFGDIDSQGHVNNCRFLSYLEDARLEMSYADFVRKGEQPMGGTVVSRHEIEYKRPLLFTVDPIRVETWVTEARAASCTLHYEVRDDEHLYAVASSVLVAFDAEKGRLRRFTPLEREYIRRYLPPTE